MSRLIQLYYFSILGAMGGLIGWQGSNWLGLSLSPSLFLSEAVAGAFIGLSIGLLLGIAEGFVSRNLLATLRATAIHGALGLAAGAIGLPLAEALFQLLGGEPWSRAVGWSWFGLLLGLSAGLRGGSQLWKPGLGGAIGGALGALLLEASRAWLADPLSGKAVGLGLMGASIGAFIALIVLLLSHAWLEVVSGKLKGAEFVLDKFMKSNGPSAYIGSSALKADIVLPDPDVAPQHALISGADTHLRIKDISLEGTFIDARKVQQANLKRNQTIRMGNTELVYRERR